MKAQAPRATTGEVSPSHCSYGSCGAAGSLSFLQGELWRVWRGGPLPALPSSSLRRQRLPLLPRSVRPGVRGCRLLAGPCTLQKDSKRKTCHSMKGGRGRKPGLPEDELSGCASRPHNPETPRLGPRSRARQARGPPWGTSSTAAAVPRGPGTGRISGTHTPQMHRRAWGCSSTGHSGHTISRRDHFVMGPPGRVLS